MEAHKELIAFLKPLIRRYELVRVIGEGGMGLVAEARVPSSGERVAIKLIRPARLADLEMRRRFQRESKLLIGLLSPNIVRVLDTGEVRGWHYLVMEYVEGENLAQLLERRPRLPVSEALSILDALAQALATLHTGGIVHRDLKPANVLVTAHGFVRLIDFGLASDPGQTTLTQAGAFVGTVAYAAPECLELKPATVASDVWQLGAMFFEMVTGSRGFRRHDAMAVMAEALDQDPAKEAAIALCRPLLEADPKKRVASGAALVALRAGRAPLGAATERLVERPAPPEAVATTPSMQRPQAAPVARRGAAEIARTLLGWSIILTLIVVALATVLLMPELMRRMGR